MGAFRWGIAGFGWVARDFVAPAMASAGHVLACVADPDAASRADAAVRGVAAFADAEAMLDAGGIDALYVATPNHRHRVVVEAAAARGVPVLCEKPLAASVADAEAIASAVRAHGIAFRTAFDQRHHPAHAAIRDALRAGRIGRPVALRIVYACWLGPTWSPDGRARGNWRTDPAQAGGGALIDLAPHGIDLASFLLDADVVSLAAVLQRRVHDYAVDDGALLAGATADGVLVSLHVAYNHPDTLPRRRLEVVGTEGLITGTNTMGQEPGGSVVLLPAAADGAPDTIRFDADASPFARQVAAFAHLVGRGGRDDDGLARDLAHFRLLAGAAEAARCR